MKQELQEINRRRPARTHSSWGTNPCRAAFVFIVYNGVSILISVLLSEMWGTYDGVERFCF